MTTWTTIEDLVSGLLAEFEAAKRSGASDDAAMARAAAVLAVRRDDIARLEVSYGLAEIVLRSAFCVLRSALCALRQR